MPRLAQVTVQQMQPGVIAAAKMVPTLARMTIRRRDASRFELLAAKISIGAGSLWIIYIPPHGCKTDTPGATSGCGPAGPNVTVCTK